MLVGPDLTELLVVVPHGLEPVVEVVAETLALLVGAIVPEGLEGPVVRSVLGPQGIGAGMDTVAGADVGGKHIGCDTDVLVLVLCDAVAYGGQFVPVDLFHLKILL